MNRLHAWCEFTHHPEYPDIVFENMGMEKEMMKVRFIHHRRGKLMATIPMLLDYAEDVRVGEAPDFYVVDTGSNDIQNYLQHSHQAGQAPFHHKTDEEMGQMLAHWLMCAVDKLRAAGAATIFVAGALPRVADGQYGAASFFFPRLTLADMELCKGRSVAITEAFNEHLRRLCRARDGTIFLPKEGMRQSWEDKLCFDGVHLTDEAMVTYFKKIRKQLIHFGRKMFN